MSNPAVSVVMPAYNHERFVGEAIESVLAQTCADLELVIVDDGSSDDTAGVIRRFSDPRIAYHHQPNRDAFDALNRGVALSSGRYVSILNSDDVYAPTRLARGVETCEAGAGFVFTEVEPIDAEGASLSRTDHPWDAWHRGNRAFYFEENDLYRGFLHGNLAVSSSNLFITRDLANRVGPFAPIRYLHDYDFVFRLLMEAEHATVYLHDEALLRYRVHAGNTLNEAAVAGREQDRETIRKYLLARLPEDVRSHAVAGIDRLIALEHELVEARRSEPQTEPSGRNAARRLPADPPDRRSWLSRPSPPSAS